MRTLAVIWVLAIFGFHLLRAGENARVASVAQLRMAAMGNSATNYTVQLEGAVWWADTARHRLILADDSGVAELEAEWNGAAPEAGQRVRLEGSGAITRHGEDFRIGCVGAVVDNDGVHALTEKSGTVYLHAGFNPIRLDWFNQVEGFGLEVQYAGPGLPRQTIPGGDLFRGTNNLETESESASGFKYGCYNVMGEAMPDFNLMTPIKSGTVTNFDLSILPRTEHVGVRFAGWLKVPREGFYTFYLKSDDGSRLFAGEPGLELTTTGRAKFPPVHSMIPGETWTEGTDCQWAQVEGLVAFVSERDDGVELDINSGVGSLRVEIADGGDLSAAWLLNNRIRATGVCQSVLTADHRKIAGRLLVASAKQIEVLPAKQSAPEISGTNSLPLLMTCGEVHRLTREEAQRGYPVKIRGVVTCVLPEHQAFTIQDATRGLYVEDWSDNRSAPPQVGDFLELEGTTDPSKFAPIVKAAHLASLGVGKLPEPARPTWDQLLNGSLDAQYVELQGIITAVATNGVMLLTRDGRIKLELRVNHGASNSPGALAGYPDALVRIRGCLLASWDYLTHEVKAGEIRIYSADLSVDAPAPADLFALPAKSVAQLQLFDPQASVFQRVKVAGQILHVNGAEHFLSDGKHGLRFLTKNNPGLAPGDLVEVAGFPQLSGVSPVLREAVTRKTGLAPLPPARELTADNLVNSDCDAMRVRIQGVFVSVRETPTEQILEIQNGVRTFIARLNHGGIKPPPGGSRLELTGTYFGQGGDWAMGQGISSFELLLNSPADVRILSRPPWWTLERLLITVGALVCVLAATMLWVTQLHRQVEQRTAELEAQIRERQRIEQQHVMEQERARVAQDLHDELGSSLTEISMLGARAKSAQEDKRKFYLEQMSDKAREMIAALDEIVWAMNPRHDSLASLTSYFCLYADRFLGLAGIAWKLENSPGTADCAVDSRHRHQLFLAFKEALTNVVRHAGASEVRLSICRQNGEVRLEIADNGRGLPPAVRTEEMDGVMNMRARLEKLGGRFEVASEAGHGTQVKFYFPAS
jgi:signal transduction histidine kinase